MHTSKAIATAHATARKAINQGEVKPLTTDERDFVLAFGASLGLQGAELDEFVSEAEADPDHSEHIEEIKQAEEVGA